MFSIQVHSGVPIYRQIVEQVVRSVDAGQLPTGDLLPSVRVLASELGVNPMTVSRAYSQLESDSVVERKRGVGMVVVRKPLKPQQHLQPVLEQLVADAKQLGLSEKQVVQWVRQYWKRG
ncbi:MAG: GntR family transcriptional regulator [Planctomycetota bacterium]